MDPLELEMLASRLEAAKRQALIRLNRELFADGGQTYAPAPSTWRTRLRSRLAPIRGYLSTLWRALKGEDPYEHDDC